MSPQTINKFLTSQDTNGKLYLPKNDVQDHILSHLDQGLQDKLLVENHPLEVLFTNAENQNINTVWLEKHGSKYAFTDFGQIVRDCSFRRGERIGVCFQGVVNGKIHIC